MATFKTRARTLDMLGRQQIAGLPTAISELFKNAHDAYADHAEIDYYRSDGLFVLRDDGLGMTEAEFLQRWLTLGTESKMGGCMTAPPRAQNKPLRPMLGEKGIGRLAIASIGSQVLVLTRAVRDGAVHDLVAAFIHWGIFECPGINLDDIEIPVRRFPDGRLPSRQELKELVDLFRQNVECLQGHITPEDCGTILNDLDKFDLDPQRIDSYVPSLSLAGQGHGTHFVIKPASEILQQDIDVVNSDGSTSLTRMLIGFTDTMSPGHQEPAIKVAFRDHKTDDAPWENLIDPSLFFTPEEFWKADHRVYGNFDDYGQFLGTVEVYDKIHHDHVISWKGGRGLPTRCGSFSIAFATVQGKKKATLLAAEDWGDLINKMEAYGGLYIYRDGIRILPYGNADYDWLEIEKNRSKKADYYFFSFRRMFGVVTITRAKNASLQEKAGREGFRENEAYRQFRSILKNFFTQLAADYFRKDSPDPDFAAKKDELERRTMLRERREKAAGARRAIIEKDLKQFFTKYDAGDYGRDAEKILADVRLELEALSHVQNTYTASEGFLYTEEQGRKRLTELEQSCRIVRPQGLALPTKLQKDWEDYLGAFAALQQDVFKPAFRSLDELVGELARSARLVLDRRLRLERALENLARETRRIASKEKKSTTSSIEHVQQKVIAETQASGKRIAAVLSEVSADLARLDIRHMSDDEIVAVQTSLEQRLLTTRQQECDLLQSIRGQLEAIDVSGGGGLLDQMEAVEERALTLEEQADADLQLTQLGMAIEVINHEFSASIRAVRNNLRRLKNWADANPSLEGLYQNIRTSFDHLDGYLGLFTPLHRRLYRKAIVFKGSDIYKFLSNLFQERFKRHEVELKGTDAFMNTRIEGYPSSFYPVFVNLVDNAVFWLRDQPVRVVTLDASTSGELIIRDTGPGIPERDRESIFEFGFSRKPGGRGMGLYISREVLRKIGYDLACFALQTGAEFHIIPPVKEKGTDATPAVKKQGVGKPC